MGAREGVEGVDGVGVGGEGCHQALIILTSPRGRHQALISRSSPSGNHQAISRFYHLIKCGLKHGVKMIQLI